MMGNFVYPNIKVAVPMNAFKRTNLSSKYFNPATNHNYIISIQRVPA